MSPTSSRPPLHLVVALPAEAKPVNAHFGLQRRQPERGFPLYQRGNLSLVLSGPGRVASAAASAWLQATNGHPANALWLNLGIAGHRDRPLGQALLAERIRDRAGGDWQLPLPQAPLPGETLVTLDQPQAGYPDACAYDLEAAGYYPSACRFVEPARVHCLKIISDNAAHPISGINGKRVRQWVQDQLPALEAVIHWLDPRVLDT